MFSDPDCFLEPLKNLYLTKADSKSKLTLLMEKHIFIGVRYTKSIEFLKKAIHGDDIRSLGNNA